MNPTGKYLLLSIVLLLYQVVLAQPLATNAQWSYCYFVGLEHPIPYEDLVITSEDPFEVAGKSCNTMRISGPSTIRTRDSIVLCYDSDKVYYLEKDSFFLLYDFGLGVGDTLQVRFPLELDTSYLTDQPGSEMFFDIKIDSVGTETLGDVDLRKQYFTVLNPNALVHFGSFIRERTGFEYWLLPYFGYEALDGDGIGGLSNYADSEIDVDFEQVCMTTSVFQDEVNVFNIKIYPNPFRETVTVKSDVHFRRADVFSMTGAHAGTLQITDGDLSLSDLNLQPGMYLIKLYSVEGSTFARVMKH